MKTYIFTEDFYDIIYNFKPLNPKKGELFTERNSDGWFKFNRKDEYWSVHPNIIKELISKGVLNIHE